MLFQNITRTFLCNITIIKNLLTTIDNSYKYENLIIFAAWEFIRTPTFLDFFENLNEIEIKPKICVSEMRGVELNYMLNDNSLTVVFSKGSDDEIIPILNRVLRGFRTNKLLFVLYGAKGEVQLVDSAAYWLWEMQYINSIIIYENEIWSFNPFPNISMILQNETKLIDVFPFEQREKYDLQGYVFSAPPSESMPRIFYKTDKDGNTTLSGVNGYLFLYFLDFMNMSWDGWEWVDEYNETVRDILSFLLVTNYSAEMSVQASVIVYSVYDFHNSYPTDIVDACYMLPVRNSLPSYLYLIRPFSSSTWLVLTILVFYSALWIYGLLRITFLNSVDIFICFQQSLCVVLNSSNMVSIHFISF